MGIYSDGRARIRHATTGRVYVINGDELDWQQVSADERQMGYETHHEAQVEHQELGSLRWSLWEYPSGAENMRETDVGQHTLLEDLVYGLTSEDPS